MKDRTQITIDGGALSHFIWHINDILKTTMTDYV